MFLVGMLTVVLKLEWQQNHLKTKTAGPHLRVSDSAGPGWGRRICISNKFSGNADAAGLGLTVSKINV